MTSFPAVTQRETIETTATLPRRRSSGAARALAPTRERILQAAAQLFAEHGFASTSMPTIAAQSCITAGAIYRHFTSKAELLLEVVKRALEALPFSFERSRGGEDAAQLPEVAARFTDPALTLLRQLAVEVHATARRDPEVRKLLTAYNEMAFQRIRALLASEPPASTPDATRSPEFIARALMVFFMGLHHMDTLHPHLVGDPAWRDFVAAHVATLLGLPAPTMKPTPSGRERTAVRRVHSFVRREQERKHERRTKAAHGALARET
jgi:AcrR family transcriptional regulator